MRADLLPGIGGHRVERELGAGGMGQVFLCHDEALQRLVAIKVLLPELLEQEEMRARFLREARALAKVSSPHVVAVHAVGEDAIVGPFVVMEYLDGEDLHARLVRDKKIPWREAVAITRDAVQGLVAAENAGIVHRDLKPANLFVVAGRAKLTDFGLARAVQGSASVTQAGIIVGTPAYLAPEVIRGAPASHQSDLYSLCATLHHLIAGAPPFTAEAPLECLAQAVMEQPKPLRTLVDDVPEALERCVLRGLMKKPEERQQGWAALDEELAAVLTGASPATSPATSRTLLFDAPVIDGPASAPSTSAAGRASAASLSDVPTVQMQLGAVPRLEPAVEPWPAHAPPHGEVSSPSIRIKTAALTVMMTDIAGYTERTSRVSREESARWLALHDALLQPIFRSFGGRVVKTLGDAFLVTFSSPTDATLCACAVQDRLWHHNRGLAPARPEDAIHVRVALSAGEVRLHKGDIFGEPVNLAARLEGLAKPGEVLVTDAVYATMNTSEVKLVSRGEHTFKGISRSVTVWAAHPDGLEGAPPFGGRALTRVNTSVVDALAANVKASAPRALEAVRSISPRVLLAGGLLLALVLLGTLLVGAGDDRLERIERGEAKSVLEDFDKIPEAEREGEDLAIAGHARWKLDKAGTGKQQRALDLYGRAVDKGYVDERMKDAVVSQLNNRDADAAVALLGQWPGSAIDAELRALLAGDDFWTRMHALEILEIRKTVDDEARIALGLGNLGSDNCNERREGVKLLKKHGRSSEALAALRKLGTDPLRNACLIFDLPSAEDAVKKRIEE